jgi:branched-chain amino acid transport system ATP-binding protein
MTVLLEIKDLIVYYEKAKALNGINLHVDFGEIVAIVGANGMGKTTIVRAISGLNKLRSGEIWFQNQRIDKLAPHEIVRKGITQIPSGRMLISEMTVMDNLRIGAYGRKNYSEVSQDLKDVLNYFPSLENKLGQKAGQLSGGQQQMVAIGRGLMAKPKLLLMDEPSTGLSPMLVEEMGRIIQEINKQGISILLVEQNCQLAFDLAKRAYILESGVVVMEGETDKLVNDERVQKVYLGY